MKRNVLPLLMAAFVLVGCEGPVGPEGPRGPAGESGPAGGTNSGQFEVISFQLQGSDLQVAGQSAALVLDIPMMVEYAEVRFRLTQSAAAMWVAVPRVAHTQDGDINMSYVYRSDHFELQFSWEDSVPFSRVESLVDGAEARIYVIEAE